MRSKAGRGVSGFMVGSFMMGNAYFRERKKKASNRNVDVFRFRDQKLGHLSNNNNSNTTNNQQLLGANISIGGGVLNRANNFGNSLVPPDSLCRPNYHKRQSQLGNRRKDSNNSNFSNNSKSGGAGGPVSYFNAIKEARSFQKSMNNQVIEEPQKNFNVRLKKSSTLKVFLVRNRKGDRNSSKVSSKKEESG